MHLPTLLLAAIGLGATAAGPTPSSKHVRHEKRDHVPSSWIRKYKATAGALPVRIGMTQSNLDAGHDMLMAV